ncbi:hypothetical protein Ahy_A09g045383 [Arachis hypogaea]|uniref:Uncharacterized protein n=1 Tax=Arachis hypogaea TaxID=3818 RepID=A0A445BM77_ARAHY|nr:hypothetical protein Ahy_A09g045383 [Arachis hypogaea]
MAHYRKLQPYWASPSPVPAYSQQKVWGHHAPPVGSTPIVVGSTAQMAKAFLKTYNVAIADRPKLAAGKYTAYYYSNITWSQKTYLENLEDAIVSPEKFKKMLDELFLLNDVLNIGDFVPWINFLDLQGYLKRMKMLGKKFDRFTEHVLDEHIERRKAVD